MKGKAIGNAEMEHLSIIISNLAHQVELLRKENKDLVNFIRLNFTKFTADNVLSGTNLEKSSSNNVVSGTKPEKDYSTRIVKTNKPGHYAGNDDVQPVVLLTKMNVKILGGRLRRYFSNKIKRTYLRGLAQELLLLYNEDAADSLKLRKASNLSVSGFKKHLPMILRKNFIRRRSFKNYSLTAFSTELIQKTFDNPFNMPNSL